MALNKVAQAEADRLKSQYGFSTEDAEEAGKSFAKQIRDAKAKPEAVTDQPEEE